VTIQVLVQTRDHLIRRTFEAIAGAKRAIVHIYNSTSPLQRRVTFADCLPRIDPRHRRRGREAGEELVPTIPDTEIVLQYSPESFSDTELDFSLECCHAVMDVWQPTPEKKIILNLPATVEWTTPNVHADQIEWMCRNLNKPRGRPSSRCTPTTTAAPAWPPPNSGLMAGADRVEGTLFGNGERTGNLDIVIVALNMNSHGIPPAWISPTCRRCARFTSASRGSTCPSASPMPASSSSPHFPDRTRTRSRRASTAAKGA
jgi:2-isopropylmalate synthase